MTDPAEIVVPKSNDAKLTEAVDGYRRDLRANPLVDERDVVRAKGRTHECNWNSASTNCVWLNLDPAAVVSSAQRQRAQLNNPPIDANQYLDILRRQGLVQITKMLAGYRTIL
jgi:hypothetical protein